jgi:ABC-type Zn2+ transport system substrate-binding protein/surface adhesin
MTAAHGTPESHDEHATAPEHAAAHDAAHDEHHDDMGLGGIDWPMWGAGVLGVAVAAIVIAATVIATDFAFLGVTAAH